MGIKIMDIKTIGMAMGIKIMISSSKISFGARRELIKPSRVTMGKKRIINLSRIIKHLMIKNSLVCLKW